MWYNYLILLLRALCHVLTSTVLLNFSETEGQDDATYASDSPPQVQYSFPKCTFSQWINLSVLLQVHHFTTPSPSPQPQPSASDENLNREESGEEKGPSVGPNKTVTKDQLAVFKEQATRISNL